jgi:hypothetical protein
VNIPKELQDILDDLEKYDAEKDKMAKAITGNKLGWRCPPEFIVPDDIRQSFLTGRAH